MTRDYRLIGKTLIICAALCGLFLLALSHAHAHWSGPQPIGAPDKAWWDSLQAKGNGVPCCDIADGRKVEDVDWDTARDANGAVHYRVWLSGKWIDVPDDAVVTTPNKFGPAVVWPYQDGSGATQIRCFMPGAGA